MANCTTCSRVYAWLSNLCKAYLHAFVVCQVNAFLGASDGQTAGNSDTLSMVSSNVTTLIGRLACELRLARTTQESHDSHISSGALEYFFCWLSILCRSCIFHPCDMLPHFPLLYFPLPHFQRPQLHMHLTALEHITLTSR